MYRTLTLSTFVWSTVCGGAHRQANTRTNLTSPPSSPPGGRREKLRSFTIFLHLGYFSAFERDMECDVSSDRA
ncbi:hypothetical protein C7212DRAFT_316462 [Tuber magnatum]|uniref:Uncharacterized protein n=1 Tax=Tuber magnatum TaxID=42249 RepID=A0A317SUT8_9PEZI|nr:hypothetical protein C7212DRAFT_316462 [Tuber magnatum]